MRKLRKFDFLYFGYVHNTITPPPDCNRVKRCLTSMTEREASNSFMYPSRHTEFRHRILYLRQILN